MSVSPDLGPVAEAFAHCAQLVRDADRDRFLAALFAPAARRPALYALHAFDLETRRIADRVRDPLAGEIRVQWWREVLGGERAGEAAAHPVARALLAVIERHGVSPEPLSAMLEGRELALYAEPFPTEEAFRDFAARADAQMVRAGWTLLAQEGEAIAPEMAEAAGLASTINDVLIRLTAEAARGRCLLPAELLLRYGVTCAEVTAGRSSPGLKNALAELRGEARAASARLKERLRRRRSGAEAIFLPALLVPLYLDRMERADYDPFKTVVEVPQWRRQWRMWRLARA